jgi:hypothetical protein
MGGRGPGHKSWRAQEARRINIRKARAARRREPLPWRSGLESRVIEQLVWQWWTLKKEASGERMRRDEPPMAIASQARPAAVGGRRFARPGGDFGRRGRAFGAQGGWMIPAPWQPASASPSTSLPSGARASPSLTLRASRVNEKAGASAAMGRARKEMPAYKLARMLGVSHTWVNKLAKRFEADPERARRRNGAFAPATLATLERAQEETNWQRQHGRLRDPMPRRRLPD